MAKLSYGYGHKETGAKCGGEVSVDGSSTSFSLSFVVRPLCTLPLGTGGGAWFFGIRVGFSFNLKG